MAKTTTSKSATTSKGKIVSLTNQSNGNYLLTLLVNPAEGTNVQFEISSAQATGRAIGDEVTFDPASLTLVELPKAPHKSRGGCADMRSEYI